MPGHADVIVLNRRPGPALRPDDPVATYCPSASRKPPLALSRPRSLSSWPLLAGLEVLGKDAAAIRGGADRQAARVGIVVGDEDDEGEADHEGDRAGADSVEESASPADQAGVPGDAVSSAGA